MFPEKWSATDRQTDRQMDRWTDVQKKWHTEVGAPPKNKKVADTSFNPFLINQMIVNYSGWSTRCLMKYTSIECEEC